MLLLRLFICSLRVHLFSFSSLRQHSTELFMDFPSFQLTLSRTVPFKFAWGTSFHCILSTDCASWSFTKRLKHISWVKPHQFFNLSLLFFWIIREERVSLIDCYFPPILLIHNWCPYLRYSLNNEWVDSCNIFSIADSKFIQSSLQAC